ncbi:MAG: hypothetical protein AB8G16_01685 [Gammaproteobacteria bacterium]
MWPTYLSRRNSRAVEGGTVNDVVSVRSLLLAIVMGVSFFFLNELAHAFFTRTPLPELLKNYWYDHPRLGVWAIGALRSLVVHWLIGIGVGLALALAVRRDFLFYGAVATGAWLIMAVQMRLDGWYALLQFGSAFWLSMRVDAISLDPIGALSALIALPLCTWWWGRSLNG